MHTASSSAGIVWRVLPRRLGLRESPAGNREAECHSHHLTLRAPALSTTHASLWTLISWLRSQTPELCALCRRSSARGWGGSPVTLSPWRGASHADGLEIFCEGDLPALIHSFNQLLCRYGLMSIYIYTLNYNPKLRSFCCSNCSSFGHRELFRVGGHVLSTPQAFCALSGALLSGTAVLPAQLLGFPPGPRTGRLSQSPGSSH